MALHEFQRTLEQAFLLIRNLSTPHLLQALICVVRLQERLLTLTHTRSQMQPLCKSEWHDITTLHPEDDAKLSCNNPVVTNICCTLPSIPVKGERSLSESNSFELCSGVDFHVKTAHIEDSFAVCGNSCDDDKHATGACPATAQLTRSRVTTLNCTTASFNSLENRTDLLSATHPSNDIHGQRACLKRKAKSRAKHNIHIMNSFLENPPVTTVQSRLQKGIKLGPSTSVKRSSEHFPGQIVETCAGPCSKCMCDICLRLSPSKSSARRCNCAL